MMRRTIRHGLALLLMGLSASSQAQEQLQRWVYGSWVNVRADAAADGAVLAHVTSNTQVWLRAQSGKTCEIAWGKDQHGFLPCKLLGERPLTLAEVATEAPAGALNTLYSPARAFWLAPSMDALFHAGKHFQKTQLTPQQLELENGGKPGHAIEVAPRLLRFPIPEFEAMKAALAAGLVASNDRDPPLLTCQQAHQASQTHPTEGMVWGKLNPSFGAYPKGDEFPHTGIEAMDCRIPALPALALPRIRPSLFKSAREIAPGSAGIERLGAHFGIVERGRVNGAVKWDSDEQGYRYMGAWDIGRYELTLDQALIEHVIGRDGRVGAYQWTPQEVQTPFGPLPDSPGMNNKRRGTRGVAGYPKIKDALLWFQSTIPLPYQSAKIIKRTERIPPSPTGYLESVVAYEVDLNGDGIADFVQWDIVGGDDEVDGVTWHMVFVNINGEWYPFETEVREEG